ncbi:MAG TPA: methyltransferase domain-containing protein [Candidatus Aquilonibacter sp.]|nr:methyltransferase domain-containing protein [Candidatus Aquilonibacter sp.]
MNESLMEFLRCPACFRELTLAVYEAGETDRSISAGLLQCSCGKSFPVWRGVPRMLLDVARLFSGEFVAKFSERLRRDAPQALDEVSSAKHTSHNYSFDVEWSMYRFGELTWELDLATRVRHVYDYLRMSPGSLGQATVLDAGCGNGTLAAGLAASGPRVIALDYSECIARAETEKARFAGRAAERLDYVQADLQRPPFAAKTFDVICSDGVLHHTPDTYESFRSVAPLVKDHGRMFVWLYRADLSPVYKLKSVAIKAIRGSLRPLPATVLRKLCYAGAVALQTRLRLLSLVGIRKRRIVPIWLKAVNLFDTFAPLYNHQHIPSEVMSWFREAGFSQAVETTIPSLGHMGFGILGARSPVELHSSSEAARLFGKLELDRRRQPLAS